MFAKKIILNLLIIAVYIPMVFPDSIRISQIDSNSLLLNQQISLYLSVTDNQGKSIENLEKNTFRIFESSKPDSFKQIPQIIDFKAGTNYEKGVSFLLLIDNSESMYWTLEGRKTAHANQRRIASAKQAVKSFLKSMTNPKDRVGLAVYNSYYKSFSAPVSNKVNVEAFLQNISRPKGDEIYSEIYSSLGMAAEEFQTTRGRKAIIILSDGVNNPTFRHTKKINKQFNKKNTPYTEPLQALQLEGISLYVINFGKKGDRKDRNLIKIAEKSGGATFDAHNSKQLRQVYLTIMDQILNEYVITYQAGMQPADKKYVKVNYENKKRKKTVLRFYYSGTVFGQPHKTVNGLIFISLLLAVIMLWILTRLKFEKQPDKPTIEVMNAGAANIATQILTLGGDQTIIGGAQSADMTIAGVPTVEENHATIVFDKKADQYKIEGNGKFMVNNQLVQTRILESGDLINIDGTTIVFDDGKGE